MNPVMLKTVWMGAMLGALIATAPTWLTQNPADAPGYDAPWVYPASNPVVQEELSQKK